MKRLVTIVPVIALALGSFATLRSSAVLAQEGESPGGKSGCAAFTWDVSHELAVLDQPAQTLVASRSAAKAVHIELDKHYLLKLAPQSEVKYAAKVSKPLAEGAQGGLVTVHVNKAGRYRVSLTTSHWLDLLDGKNLVVSRDFQGQRDCEKVHKIVEFELAGERDFVLQLSGGADATVGLAVTQVK